MDNADCDCAGSRCGPRDNRCGPRDKTYAIDARGARGLRVMDRSMRRRTWREVLGALPGGLGPADAGALLTCPGREAPGER
jgi:hypothetical protein